PCEALSNEEGFARLRRLADGLVMESVFSEGIPVAPSGKPSRPLEVLVTWTDGDSDASPVANLPLTVTEGTQWFRAPSSDTGTETETEDSTPVSVRTAELGVATFNFLQQPSDLQSRLGVELDRQALLGSLAESFPEIVLSVPFRRVQPSAARVGLSIRETGADGETTHMVQALQDRLSGSRQVVLLDRDAAALVSDGVTPERMDALAQMTRGRVDLLIIGAASSQLTSRMGSRSVYHEASATLRVYNIWTGEKLSEVSDSQQALGLGEARAAKNALKQLGETLAGKIETALQRPVAAQIK
ncbi:MAG: hypothetical protein AAFQ82_27415, partial [Myxococcota bacterium]